MGKINKKNIIDSDSRYRASTKATDTEFQTRSGRDNLPETHPGRLPPCAGAAGSAPLIRNAFGRSESRKTTLARWTWCTEGLSHKLSHSQIFLCGIHCRLAVTPQTAPALAVMFGADSVAQGSQSVPCGRPTWFLRSSMWHPDQVSGLEIAVD